MKVSALPCPTCRPSWAASSAHALGPYCSPSETAPPEKFGAATAGEATSADTTKQATLRRTISRSPAKALTSSTECFQVLGHQVNRFTAMANLHDSYLSGSNID